MDVGTRSPLDEAQRRILAWAVPTVAEGMPLLKANGLRLAEPVRTHAPIPAFARSGMDGYAVIAADLASASPQSPVMLRLLQGDARGAVTHRVRPGEAMRVGTGGPLPEGADTVVMQEAVAIKEGGDGIRQAVFFAAGDKGQACDRGWRRGSGRERADRCGNANRAGPGRAAGFPGHSEAPRISQAQGHRRYRRRRCRARRGRAGHRAGTQRQYADAAGIDRIGGGENR
ncbi:MoeA family protein [Cohnella rhizosphaerae]|uniref:Molybdopterin molybdenumtransferase n=1 Tax=Cohnella rhizosphaerae TaxID=1457232 RepID=A0A9X4KNP3_9BACL|nr:hypothetical protein [Cohnella rhizosphaerae]MDG0808279.1 hypothetical protein [Cohnella rhizosphaerae]